MHFKTVNKKKMFFFSFFFPEKKKVKNNHNASTTNKIDLSSKIKEIAQLIGKEVKREEMNISCFVG